MPRLRKDVEFITNGDYLYSNKNPDVQLVEPPIQCSINRNYLKFPRKMNRPPQSHSIIIVNHGDYPVAFKLLCTDNRVYFTSQKTGVIPGRRLNALPHLRMANAVQIDIYRRSMDAIDKDLSFYYSIPKKDRLFILLTNAHSHSIAPSAYFHPAASYAKLRVCLEHTAKDYNEEKWIKDEIDERAKKEKGKVKDDKDKGKDEEEKKKSDLIPLIYRKAKGWCTWDVSAEKFTDAPPSLVAMKKAKSNKDESEGDESEKNSVSKKAVSVKKPKINASKKGQSAKKVNASKKGKSAKGVKTDASQKGVSAKNLKADASKKLGSVKNLHASKKANKSAKNQKPIPPKSAESVGVKQKTPEAIKKASAEVPKTVDVRKGASKMVKPMSKEAVPSKTVMPLAPGAKAMGPVSFFAQPKK